MISTPNSLIIKVLSVVVLLLVPRQAPCQTEHCSSGKWSVGNGYTADCWYWDDFKGSACLTTYGSTSFRIDWNIPAYGFLHEVGRYDKDMPDIAIADMNVNAVATYTHAFGSVSGVGGYTGFYGWLLQHNQSWPTGSVEYYIVEDWAGSGSMPAGDSQKGTIAVDGGTYNIYYSRIQQWEQWWSVRTSKRTSGTIHYVQHFRAWKDAGMPEKYIGRLAFMFESQWGGPSAGSLTYSAFSINLPNQATAVGGRTQILSSGLCRGNDEPASPLHIFHLDGSVAGVLRAAGATRLSLVSQNTGAVVALPGRASTR